MLWSNFRSQKKKNTFEKTLYFSITAATGSAEASSFIIKSNVSCTKKKNSIENLDERSGYVLKM